MKTHPTSLHKTAILGIAAAAALLACAPNASAQALVYVTTEDFGQFTISQPDPDPPIPATTNTDFFSVSDAVNGIGNSTDPGGAGTVGSLELTSSGGFSFNIGNFPGQTAASFTALSPGSLRPFSAESGFGPGTMVANSGTMTLDVYTGNLTDFHNFGILLNYNGTFATFFATSSSTFTGADGNMWTNYVIPYTTNAVELTYFGMSIAENSGAGNAGQILYIDNIQIVPEPTTAMLLMGGTGMVAILRRRHRKAGAA